MPTLDPWIPGLTFQGLTREILRDGDRDDKKERRKEDRRNREERSREVLVCCVEEAAKTHTQRP